MEVDCEGCAGCCVDWRALTDAPGDHERGGDRQPLDDTYNLTPLRRGEVRTFVDAGLGDALTPRLWRDAGGVEIDGRELAGVGGRPAFFVGLRKIPKPVAPFDVAPRRLPACVFLDPETLQCRIHGDELYPQQCASYPGHNLTLDQETECERVERSFGGDRLLDDEPPEDAEGLLLGPQALGEKLFVHPEPERLAGVVDRVARGEPTAADRAEFVGVAAASSPGATGVDERRYEAARERALEADSWVGETIAEGTDRADAATGEADAAEATAPSLASAAEEDRGAPETPGWD
ncbi:YkgJ family cysteine cluster protein [Natronoarchaeum mannanilyticum]|uniref:YkgJ family cysteine cluster protein n=2 Tax=Natronoarchaeum mannanilyticum TaxID=926360 RepID=A0AAV3TAY3_9EURY